MNIRYWTNRIHLWIGLSLALPLILISLSGSVLVYRWSLDARLNHDWYSQSTDVREATDDINWDRLLQVARENSATGTVNLIWVSPAGRGALLAETTDHSWIHIDPHRAELIGIRSESSWRSIVWQIQEFHRNLFLGEWGSFLVSSITVIAVISLITGLILWLLPISKAWIARLGIRLNQGVIRVNWDAHNAIGFYTTLITFLIFVTGAVIGFWSFVKPAVYEFTNSKPLGFQSPSVDSVEDKFSLGRAVDRARDEWPDAQLKRIVVPRRNGQSIRMRFQSPGTPYEPGFSWIWIDPYRSEVMKKHHRGNRSIGDDLYLWLFPLHFGGWGFVWGSFYQGITRVIWFIGTISVSFLSVTGFLIWYWR